jgi:hypothetical protein
VPLPCTQILPHIDEGHKIKAFIGIEEVELQHSTTIAGTSAEAAVGSSQNDGGGS